MTEGGEKQMAGSQDTAESRVSRFIRQHGLAPENTKLVVAVSGGPDSVCLLNILWSLREELGIELHVAHLNHQLRGKGSAADAEYVQKMSGRLGIPITLESRDVTSFRAKNRLSLEEAAREVRYAFLAEVAAAVGTERVAVGHTTDDNVETILMHLLRGSGIRGMRGLLPLTAWPTSNDSITVIRPLLELTREETEAYCRRHRLAPRSDASNLSPEPFRNRVRHELLPTLRTYNPQVDRALLRLAQIAGDDLEFIESEAARHRKDLLDVTENAVAIDKNRFMALPVALQRHLLRDAVETLTGSLKDIEAEHIEEVLKALDKPSGRVIGLRAGSNLTIEPDRYVLARDSVALCPYPPLPESEIELNVPGTTEIPGWTVEAVIVSTSDLKKGEEDNLTAHLDYSSTGNQLSVRNRRPGDRFQPLGMAGTKKLNAFMIDEGIPRSWRSRIPIVSSGERVVWVVGRRIDDRVKVTETTRKVLRLEFRRA